MCTDQNLKAVRFSLIRSQLLRRTAPPSDGPCQKGGGDTADPPSRTCRRPPITRTYGGIYNLCTLNCRTRASARRGAPCTLVLRQPSLAPAISMKPSTRSVVAACSRHKSRGAGECHCIIIFTARDFTCDMASRDRSVAYGSSCVGSVFSPDSPDGLGWQDRKPRKRWGNRPFLLSPVASARTRLSDPE
jgi:hypothetical protein